MERKIRSADQRRNVPEISDGRRPPLRRGRTQQKAKGSKVEGRVKKNVNAHNAINAINAINANNANNALQSGVVVVVIER